MAIDVATVDASVWQLIQLPGLGIEDDAGRGENARALGIGRVGGGGTYGVYPLEALPSVGTQEMVEVAELLKFHPLCSLGIHYVGRSGVIAFQRRGQVRYHLGCPCRNNCRPRRPS